MASCDRAMIGAVAAIPFFALSQLRARNIIGWLHDLPAALHQRPGNPEPGRRDQCLQTARSRWLKGFALNDERFKSGNSMNYFTELQERIREIRLSERFFYQKIKDIYTTSIDYDHKAEKTIEFFKVVQKKLL